MLLLQSNAPTFGLEDVWSNKTLSLRSFGPRFLTCFVLGLPHNIPADIIFSGEIVQLADSASSFGSQATTHSSIRNIFSPFLKTDQVENTQIGIHNATWDKFALSLSSPPWSVVGMPLTQ